MKLAPLNLILCFLFLASISSVDAQTTTQNYIQTFTVQVPGIINTTDLPNGISTNTALQTIQYFDGLGRPVQTVQKGANPMGHDIIIPVKYNEVGLDDINYEPYIDSTSEAASFRDGFGTAQPEFYSTLFDNDGTGWSLTDYEKSPLNRVLKQGAPGFSWQLENHPVQFEYLSNNTSDLKAKLWQITDNACSTSGDYPPNQLYVTKTISEDGPTVGSVTYEFKDKQGQVVLKRSVLNGTTNADTYYVYDDFGLLRFVISPEGSALITGISGNIDASTPLAKKYFYCYKYDSRNRLIEKQIPGKDPEYYVYDKTDKLILYQDGNMRTERVPTNYDWMFTKYDALGRVVITGIVAISKYASRDAIQSDATSTSNTCWEIVSYSGTAPAPNNNYYSDQSYPVLSGKTYSILTINYYDSYKTWINASTDPVPIANNTELGYVTPQVSHPDYQPELTLVAGKPTVSFVECNGALLASATYYDIYGRTLQTAAEHHLRGYDRYTSRYKGISTNVDNLLHMHYSRRKPDLTYTYSRSEESIYTFDHAGRQIGFEYGYYNGLLSTTKQITKNSYTILGQLKSKKVYEGTALLQCVDYQYNIRGWLTQINDPANVSDAGDLFGMQLFYNTIDDNLDNTEMFNGNISGVIWQNTPALSTSSNPIGGQKGYKYTYDKLNRLTSGDFSEILNGAWYKNGKYSESIQNYDLNGNIKQLTRYGLRAPNNTLNTIDQLFYTYDGNKLIAVDDAVSTYSGNDFTDNGNHYTGTPEYNYDRNGNLIKDSNKEIASITYNHLNLPISINRSNENRIEYIYDATGNKRSQIYHTNNTIYKTTDFVANFVYEDNVLVYNMYDEGRIVNNTNGTWFAENYLKDHLGNIRVAYRRENGLLKTRQVDSYYPFGMNIKNLSSNGLGNTRPNEYLYNGKMMQDEMGLGWLDYGARFYDPVLGRWHSIDVKAEKYFPLSPYVYGADNPILFIDTDGKEIVIKDNTRGTMTNLSMIAATTQGRYEVNRLITSPLDYKIKSTFWTSSSAYDYAGEQGSPRTIYSVASSWMPSIEGGVASSRNILAHELNHAYDQDNWQNIGDKNARETSSVNFGNYVSSVYGETDMRTSYSSLGLTFSDRPKAYNGSNEKITNFSQINDIAVGGDTYMGFSYQKSEKGEKAQSQYILGVTTESGVYAYRVFTDKKEYDEAVQRVNNLNKNK